MENQQDKIIIEAYNLGWATQFEKLKGCLIKYLSLYILGIEHVGSTSVPGLKAKPILDMDIIVEDIIHMKTVISELHSLDYIHVGDLGISGREAFKRKSENTPNDGSGTIWPAHHRYVCLQNSIGLRNHLALRDYLRNHPDMKIKYGLLKKELARQFPYNMDRYITGKTEFITDILQKYGFGDSEIDMIKTQNKI